MIRRVTRSRREVRGKRGWGRGRLGVWEFGSGKVRRIQNAQINLTCPVFDPSNLIMQRSLRFAGFRVQ
jgi:hypothetical protein